MSGYFAPNYSESFREFGEIIRLPHSGMSVIARDITGGLFDVAGLYPFSVCRDWSLLNRDVEYLRARGAVSMVLVSDPYAELSVGAALSGWSRCTPFKTHFMVNLQEDWRARLSKDTRYQLRHASARQVADVVNEPEKFAEIFWSLYQHLIARHDVHGIQRLSQHAIAGQLQVDGAQLTVAREGSCVCGALLAYDQGEVAHLHLMALSPEAYARRTSYLLLDRTLEALERRRCHSFNLGGAAGLADNPAHGLSRFKRKWAGDQRSSLLCGIVLNDNAYGELVGQAGQPGRGFFPAYRVPGGKFEWQVGRRESAGS